MTKPKDNYKGRRPKLGRVKKIGKHEFRYFKSAGSMRRAEKVANKYREESGINRARIVFSKRRMRYEIFVRKEKNPHVGYYAEFGSRL